MPYLDSTEMALASAKNDVEYEIGPLVRLGSRPNNIMDKAMHIMWEQMGWKGSAKTHDVILAIRDFYTRQLSRMNEPGSTFSQPILDTPSKHTRMQGLPPDLPALTKEDKWAIGCIRNFKLRPLHEALDSDCSGTITINELNEFTSARPSDWSLPLWLAYWTTGLEITLRQYTSRIRIELYRISSIYSSLIPGNAGAYSRLVNSDIMHIDIDRIIAGIHMLPSKGPREYLHDKFREYAANVERHIKNELESCNYFIDESNSLSLVIGPGGRLEEYALPLIYLILRRIRSILTEGKTKILTDAHFNKPLTSLETLWSVICDHGEVLKRAFKSRKLESNEELRRHCYAMYYFVTIESSKGEFHRYYNMADGFYDAPISNLNGEENTLIMDVEKDVNNKLVIDMESSLKASAELETSITIEQSLGLIGVWRGYYFFDFGSPTDDGFGIVEFRIDYINKDNTFIGTGSDSLSAFTITGKWNGRRISFWTKYDSGFRRNHASKAGWFYTGKIDDSFDTMDGNWGDPLLASTEDVQANSSSNDEDEENSEIEMDGFLGGFMMDKKVVDYTRFRPSDEEFKENKPRAYWKFALNAVIDSVSKRVFTWSNLERRRDTRHRFISLWIEIQNQNFENESSCEEFYVLREQLSAVEYRLYHHLAQRFSSRAVQHCAVCDCCQTDISATRYMCLTCSAGQYYYETVDICGDCIDKPFTTSRNSDEQELIHDSSHTLLQIRRPFTLRDQYRARRAAETTLDAHNQIQESSEILCNVCERLVEERPYWSCCVCEGLFVCQACNSKLESPRELYSVKNIIEDIKEQCDNSHHRSHDLVLIANPEPLEKSLSTEEPDTPVRLKKSLSVEELTDTPVRLEKSLSVEEPDTPVRVEKSLSVEKLTDTPVQQISRLPQDLQPTEKSRPANQQISDTTNQTIPPNRDSPPPNSTIVSPAFQATHSNVHQTSYNITVIQHSMSGSGARRGSGRPQNRQKKLIGRRLFGRPA